MFTVLNIGLFDGTEEEVAFRALKAWGFAEWVQIFFVEVFSFIHLVLFCYLCAVAYEYYAMARDDPTMIDAEHKSQATAEKAAAAERKKKELERQKKAAGNNEEIKE